MREIQLTKGRVALIDDADFERVSQHKWSAGNYPGRHSNGKRCGEKWYAKARIGKIWVYLHRFIMDAPKGMVVDHLDNDGLNCQRANMQLVTSGENTRRWHERSAKAVDASDTSVTISSFPDFEEHKEDHEDANDVEWV